MPANKTTEDIAMMPSADLRVRLVISKDAAGWILGKIARRLAEHLPSCGVNADIADTPLEDADVNHYVLYHQYARQAGAATIGITHIDDFRKVQHLRRIMDAGAIGICMSHNTVCDLTAKGLVREKLCYISPAHDGDIVPRRLVIGITTRIYSDNRKRETLLIEVAERVGLSEFHFVIYGDGWEQIIPRLEAAGATVEYHPLTGGYTDDYARMRASISMFDYYLYTGCDEGSLGTLDALAAGVPTIITPQGFHLDIPNGITHPFWTGDELCAIFRKIGEERRARIRGVQPWSWANYARQHARVWRALRDGRTGGFDELLHGDTIESWQSPARTLHSRLASTMQFYWRPFGLRVRKLMRWR